MELQDDLKTFKAHGAAVLPITDDQGYVDHEGARIWYAMFWGRPYRNHAAWWSRPRR
jgi:hypothetical protein